jgi:endonuclease YncB( thermonuclease family)
MKVQETWTCPGRVVEVHDGDTIICDIDLGYHVSIRAAVRIDGIAAPELRKAGKPNPAGEASRDYAKTLLPPGTVVQVVSKRLLGRFEKFGRVLADLLFDNSGDGSPTVDFAQATVAAGYAFAWDGTGKQPGG